MTNGKIIGMYGRTSGILVVINALPSNRQFWTAYGISSSFFDVVELNNVIQFNNNATKEFLAFL